MPYIDPSLSVEIMQHAAWYDLDVFLREINSLRKINFSITEQRAQALERFNNMPERVPFDLGDRFEKRGIFVCELSGDWARKFQQLKSALSYKDRDLRSFNVKDEKLAGDHTAANVSDAQQAFWNATTAMLDQLIRQDYVWDRKRFEAHFHLTWMNDDDSDDEPPLVNQPVLPRLKVEVPHVNVEGL